jgi:hypothetical protein
MRINIDSAKFTLILLNQRLNRTHFPVNIHNSPKGMQSMA